MSIINLKELNFSEIQETLYQFKFKIKGSDVGYHESKLKGSAFDFFDAKIYEQGDSLKSIDYKRWAKTDQYWVKRRESEKSQLFRVVLDLTESVLSENDRFNRFTLLKNFIKCLIFVFNTEHDQFLLEIVSPKNKITLSQQNFKNVAQLEKIFKKIKLIGTEIPDHLYSFNAITKNKPEYTLWISDFLQSEEKFMRNFNALNKESKNLLLVHFLLPEEVNPESLKEYDLVNSYNKHSKTLVDQTQILEFKKNFNEYYQPKIDFCQNHMANWFTQYAYTINLKNLFDKLIH